MLHRACAIGACPRGLIGDAVGPQCADRLLHVQMAGEACAGLVEIGLRGESQITNKMAGKLRTGRFTGKRTGK